MTEETKPKILVADDDQEVVDAVKMALESEDYEVLSANDGQEALEIFKEDEIDIVVSDIKMPEIDGLELLKKVKEISPSTKVIMMTAYASVDSAVEAMKEGASDYIRKPIEVIDIRTTILGSIENLEIEKFKEEASEIKRGVGEEDPHQTFENLLERGRQGVLLASEKPESFQVNSELSEKADFLSLLDEEDEVRSLKEIVEMIKTKMEEYGSLTILLDDIDYLLEENSIDDFEEFVNEIEDDIIDKNSTLIISANPDSLEEDYREELEYMASDMPARVISDSLANHIRRKVITQLSKQDEGVTFTTLSRETGINDSPKLSFHLKKLEEKGLIEKDDEKRYHLTEAGEDAFETLKKLREIRGEGFGQIAWIPQ